MDKEALLSGHLPTGKVELDAGIVQIRGLSRKEITGLAVFAGDPDGAETHILTNGMVDPAMTADEVGQWRDVANAEVGQVTDAICALSGLGEAQKSV